MRWLGQPDQLDIEQHLDSPLTHEALSTHNRSATPRKMDTGQDSALEQHYRSISEGWSVIESTKYANLVVPNGNGMAPIHRWFHLKEAFSRHLLGEVIRDARLDLSNGLRLYDPFAGVGTSLLSAVDLCYSKKTPHVEARGSEVNPFLQLISNTKLAAAINAPVDVLEAARAILSQAKGVALADIELPRLSTFHQEKYFPIEHVQQIAQLRCAIEQNIAHAEKRQLLLVCLAMTIEAAGRLRRDGRALRYEDRLTRSPFSTFETAAARVEADIAIYAKQRLGATGRVELGSALESGSTEHGSSDLVIFSPPYPNNIDYTEVYKLELWGLGFVHDSEQFRAQRQRTLRSHPSIIFDRDYIFEQSPQSGAVNALIDPVLDSIPQDSRYSAQMQRTIRGYTDDMFQVLQSSYQLLRPQGTCVYVVGNSVHGSSGSGRTLVAADIIIARLAELAGFSVSKLCIARRPPRRGFAGELLRESVVFLTKD